MSEIARGFDASRAAVLKTVNVLSYDRFMRFAIKVWVDGEDGDVHSGKLQVMVLDHVMASLEGRLAMPELLMFITLSMLPHPGPVRWSTVHEDIRLCFKPADSTAKQPSSLIH
jgi:hypothetical protein